VVSAATRPVAHRPQPGDLYATAHDVVWRLLEVPADGGPVRAVVLVGDLERCIPVRVVAEQWRLVVSGRRLAELADQPDQPAGDLAGRELPAAGVDQPAAVHQITAVARGDAPPDGDSRCPSGGIGAPRGLIT
jgi:hypothetical protein